MAEFDLAIFAPALVLLIELETDAVGEVEVHLHPGGQGYWVGRMASALGARPVLCSPIGGEAGTVVSDLLARDKVGLRSVPTKGDNGAYIHDRRDGERQILVEMEPRALGRHVRDQLFSITLAAALETGVCVVAGTQAHAIVPSETYERLVADLVETGVTVIADLAGDLLLPALAGRPYLLKISHEEAIDGGFAKDGSAAELIGAIEQLHEAGAENVVVSRAADPSLALLGGELVEVVAPHLRVADHRGAGDSMTAGLAVGVQRGLSLEQSSALGAAAGALNVTRHGLASGHSATIEHIAARVVVQPYDATHR